MPRPFAELVMASVALCKLTTGADLTVVARYELHLNTTANKKVRQSLYDRNFW